jgi:hypothetical protein
MTFELHRYTDDLVVTATATCLHIESSATSLDWDCSETWPTNVIATSRGRRLAAEVAIMLEMGSARRCEGAVEIPYDSLQDIEANELAVHTLFSEPSPFLLFIGRKGVIGRTDFRYDFSFMLGTQRVPLERMGPYLKRSATETIYHLDLSHFALVEAMDRFNNLPTSERTPHTGWLTFADVRRLSNESRTSLDRWLESNDVVVPSSIGVEFYEEADGSLSFVPTSPSLDSSDFRTVFQRETDAHGLYTLDRPGRERLRIVLTEKQTAILERMKRVQRVSGNRKAQLLADPLQVFDGVAADVELPPSYSDRVIGVGIFEYASIPKAPGDETGLSSLWNSAGNSDPTQQQVKTDSEINEGRKTLLIKTNQDQLDYGESQPDEDIRVGWNYSQPLSFVSDFRLDPHQKDGVGWLQLCLGTPRRTGVLLADDMGLGKTLQLLTFLAWVIESGVFPDLSKPRPPYRPILITAPLILLENETWESEMKRFFADKGSLFQPILPLYGATLRTYRRRDATGTEGEIGEPILDLDRIRQNRVVITNYEALSNYEFSFAYHPDGQSLWSLAVHDEAQEFKTPSSRISHAIKKLKPSFRIACTGTPVENRLLDLWNIFDAAQPGLLSSAEEFKRRWESGGNSSASITDLKRILAYQRPHTYMLRRSKAEVLALPPKTVHKISCVMGPDEIEIHRNLAMGLGRAGRTAQKTELLQSFARASQHPLLLNSTCDDVEPDELLRTCSKLRAALACICAIRDAGEKVLVFARHKDVQRILARVLSSEFGIPVRIINGDTPRATGSLKGAALTRQRLLGEFKQNEGFNVIVLSPFVAGVGLTITEANHVIHYGRWWNPAVEAQATDRAYRRGQNKPVHVYLPILNDPSGYISQTFDEVLDALMTKKEELAQSTLAKDGFVAMEGRKDEIQNTLIESLKT